MPIDYYIDGEMDLVIKRFHGDVDIAQLRVHWLQLMGDAEAMRISAWLTDIREAVIKYNGSELERLVRNVIEPRMRDRRWLSAVIANAGVQYGVTNQFAVYASSRANVATFLDREEALSWLMRERHLRDRSEGPGTGSEEILDCLT